MQDQNSQIMEIEPGFVEKLSKDMRLAAKMLGDNEVRWMVDTYYDIQKLRTAQGNRKDAAERDAEPGAFNKHIGEQMMLIEKQIAFSLKHYAEKNPIASRMLEIHGIGPIIAAGLVAHIDIKMAPYVGNIWSFAGLTPNVVWGKGQKRPWNAQLKTLCWKIGDSFVKQSGNDKCYYGKVYKKAKAVIQEKDARCAYKATAEQTLKDKKISVKEVKAVYESGHLPLGRIDLMARRVAVKMFLSHMHAVWWELDTGTAPAKPYIFSHDIGGNGPHDMSQYISPQDAGWSPIEKS